MTSKTPAGPLRQIAWHNTIDTLVFADVPGRSILSSQSRASSTSHEIYTYTPFSILTTKPKGCACALSHFSRVQLFVNLQTVVHQTSLTMGFSWQEYCSGLPFPPSGDLPNPGIKPKSFTSPVLADGFFNTSAIWEALGLVGDSNKTWICLPGRN